jgi:HEAT repeat protein
VSNSRHLRHRGSVLERLFRIGPYERGRVAVFWSATVLLETAIALSWTVLLAIVVGTWGVEKLDTVYGVHAVFSLLGTVFFASLFRRFSSDRLFFIIGCGSLIAFLGLLPLVGWTEEEQWRMMLFFTLYFVAFSYLLNRMVALNASLTYTRLSAEEGERVGPIIESAYPVGDLIAGIAVFVLAQMLSVESILLLLAPILVSLLLIWWIFLHRGWKRPRLRSHGDTWSEIDERGGLLAFLKAIFGDRFLLCMALLTLVQGTTYDLVEYQYASVVSDHAVVILPKVFQHEERERVRLVQEWDGPQAPSLTAAVVEEGGMEGTNGTEGTDGTEVREGGWWLQMLHSFRADVAEEERIAEEVEEIIEEELSAIRESSDVDLDIAIFAETLGFFAIIFSSIVILVRLFLINRLTHHIGFVRTGTIHPISMLATLGGVLALPSTWSVLTAQAAMEATEPMFEEGIGGSQYALGTREYEYMQSFQLDVVYPIASLLAAVILTAFERFGVLDEGIPRIYILFIAGIFLLVLWQLLGFRRPYRAKIDRLLGNPKDPAMQSEGVDIALQPGHRKAAELLLKNLPNLKHHHVLLHKSFRALAELKAPEAIPTILEHVLSPHPHEQIAALDALLAYEQISHPDGVSKLRSYLLESFERAAHPDVKIRSMHLLGKLSDPEVFAHLRRMLQDPAYGELRSEIVAALGHMKSDEVRNLLHPLLSDPSPSVRAQAVIGLWHFPDERNSCLQVVDQIFERANIDENLWGVIAVGVARITERWRKLVPFLLSGNRLLRFEAALNLGRLDRTEAVSPLVEVLCGPDNELANYAHRKIDDLNNEVEERVRAIAEQRLTYKVALELQRDPKEWVEDYPTETLKRAREYFNRIDAHGEVLMIGGVLEDRHEVPPSPPMPDDLRQALLGARHQALGSRR